MTQALVLTFIARDRPGLVERLSEAVAKAGGNWLESRMVRLAEKFVGVARVEMPRAPSGGAIESLRAALTALNAEGFQLTIEDASGAAAAGGGRVMMLDLVGPDHPGIIRDISHCLAKRGISVEEMETDIRAAPMSGDLLFYATARVLVPQGVDTKALDDALRVLGNTLMVDIALAPGDG